jgi:hypothetical protein
MSPLPRRGIALGTSAPDGKPSQAKPASLVTDASGRERKGGRIGRAIQRDPVGDQIPVTNTSTCSFSGVLEIILQRFLESGIEGEAVWKVLE